MIVISKYPVFANFRIYGVGKHMKKPTPGQGFEPQTFQMQSEPAKRLARALHR
jgi:hypothetical protein